MLTMDAIQSINAVPARLNLVAASSAPSQYVQACQARLEFPFVAEGYPSDRYHEGGEALDDIECLAQRLAADLFGEGHYIVQPWRCTNAIVAICFALAKPGDTILGLACKSGGFYATGGNGAHFLSKCFNVETYDVDRRTHLIDVNIIENRIREVRPQLLFIGDTSYSRWWEWEKVSRMARAYSIPVVADISQTAGLVAGGVYPSPFPHADVVVFATYKTLRGPKGAIIAVRNSALIPSVRRSLYPGTQASACPMTVTGIAAALEYASRESFRSYARRAVDLAAQLSRIFLAKGVPVISGGTETHSFVIDIRLRTNETARAVASRLAKAGILTNATPIPFDPRPVSQCSGIRIGTTALAARSDADQINLDELAQSVMKVMGN